MINKTDVFTLKAKLNKLAIDVEHKNLSREQKTAVLEYIVKVINLVEETLKS
jgi:hypothetical protein